VSADGRIACCMRVASARPARNGGWVHRLTGLVGPPPPPYTPPRPRREPPPVDFELAWRRWRENTDPGRIAAHAAALGVTAGALADLGAAWAWLHRAWAFPMRDGQGRVAGIRLRAEDGRKWAVRGSRSGIFVPEGLTGAGRLLIVEGPTDAAAARTLGFDVIGRPSCLGCIDTVTAWLAGRRFDEVVILADNDEPKPRPDGSTWCRGTAGALKLAEALKCPHRLAVPPCKDLREWVRLGAARADVEAVIASCQLRTR